jgi:hypothetical protein
MRDEPAADDVPSLPHTWRPRLGPVVAVAMGVVLVAAALGMWFGLPAETRADFSGIQTVTLALVLAAILVGLYRLAAMRLRADEKGLTVVNLVRTRRLEWAEVLNVSLRSGDPWVQLDVDDGTTVSVMAIQSADGPRARRAATQLALLVAAYTRTSRND